MDTILKRLNITKLIHSGAIEIFSQRMRDLGLLSLTYHPDKKLVTAHNLKDCYTFHSHEELDVFMTDLLGKQKSFRMDYPWDFTLLMMFDNVFWLRHFVNPVRIVVVHKGNRTTSMVCHCKLVRRRVPWTLIVPSNKMSCHKSSTWLGAAEKKQAQKKNCKVLQIDFCIFVLACRMPWHESGMFAAIIQGNSTFP